MPLLFIVPLIVASFLVLSGCITVPNAATPSFVVQARPDKPDNMASLNLFMARADNNINLFTRFSSPLSHKNFIQKSPTSPLLILNILRRIITPTPVKFPSLAA